MSESGEISFGDNAVAAGVLFVFCFVMLFMLPVICHCLRRRDVLRNVGSGELLSKLASASGGGALLGLALFDVCPELRERIDLESEYPLAEVLMIAATFLVAIVDNVIQQCFIGHAHSHSTKKSRLESRAQLLGDPNLDDEESQMSSEISSIRFAVPEVEEASANSKVTKLIIGLSLHSCLTGISIGMVSSREDLVTGVMALLPHKTAVLLLLSSMLVKVDRMKRCVHVAIFSSALPLGILIAGIVSQQTDDKWVMVTLEAIGAGAVFHVAMIEMLPEALSGDRRIIKLFFAAFGAAIIAILQVFHSHEEGEEHHGAEIEDMNVNVDDINLHS